MPLLYRLRRSVSSDRAQLRCPTLHSHQKQQQQQLEAAAVATSQQAPQPTCHHVIAFAHAPKQLQSTTTGNGLYNAIGSEPAVQQTDATGLKRGVSLSSGISAMASSSANTTLRYQQHQQHHMQKPPCSDPVRDLISAVQRNDINIVQRLLSSANGACQQRRYLIGGSKSRSRLNVNQQLKNGMSALHQAAFAGNPQMLQLLLEHGGRVDLQDSRGLTPLHVASYQGHFDSVHLLLKWNSRINAPAAGAQTPLHLACQGGHYDVVKLLLCNNADPMLRTEDGRTAFDAACEFGHFSIAQLLVSMKSVTGLLYEDCHLFPATDNIKDATVKQQQQPNWPSCLHLAARNGHTDVLRLLVNLPGVNVSRLTSQGTCLHLAVAHGHLDTARLLLEQGIDPTLQNSNGQTAKDLITRETPYARELNQILSERLSAVEAIAIRDFCDLTDPKSIAFRCGERLTVLEHAGDIWKGYVTSQGLSRAGYFPGNAAQLQASIRSQPEQQRPLSSGSNTSSTGFRNQQQPQTLGASRHPDGLVACSIPKPPTISTQSSTTSTTDSAVFVADSAAIVCASSPPGLINDNGGGSGSGSVGGGNRNSAASLDSGRSSSHTATSCDSRVSFALPPHSSNAGSNGRLTTAPAGTSTMTTPLAGSTTTSTSRGATGSQDSGLEPRQSLVSTCSSGSLGSLQDDANSTVSSSTGDHLCEQAAPYNPAEWHQAGLTSEQQLARFLNACQFGLYLENFQEAGYDLATLIRCTPEDLNAVGLTDPKHRKRLRQELIRLANLLRMAALPDSIEDAASASCPMDDVGEFCQRLNLPESVAVCLRKQGFNLVQHLANMAWEDLEEIGVSKLGHQKKLMLAIDRLKRPKGVQQLQQQQQRHTVSCGTCTASDAFVQQISNPAAVSTVQDATATPHSQPTVQPPQPPHHRTGKPVAKVLGRSSLEAADKQPQPPPLPAKVPPPPPKRVTSMLRSRDPSPMMQSPPQQQQHHQQVQSRTGAYENAGQIEHAIRHHYARRAQTQTQTVGQGASPAVSIGGSSVIGSIVSTCTRSNSTASVASIPFANENCGTIVRHKQNNQQHQQKHVASGSSPDANKRLPYVSGYQQSNTQSGSTQPGGSALLTPPSCLSGPSNSAVNSAASDSEDTFSNLDDICDMLSDLQSMLDKELRDKPLA